MKMRTLFLITLIMLTNTINLLPGGAGASTLEATISSLGDKPSVNDILTVVAALAAIDEPTKADLQAVIQLLLQHHAIMSKLSSLILLQIDGDGSITADEARCGWKLLDLVVSPCKHLACAHFATEEAKLAIIEKIATNIVQGMQSQNITAAQRTSEEIPEDTATGIAQNVQNLRSPVARRISREQSPTDVAMDEFTLEPSDLLSTPDRCSAFRRTVHGWRES